MCLIGVDVIKCGKYVLIFLVMKVEFLDFEVMRFYCDME